LGQTWNCHKGAQISIIATVEENQRSRSAAKEETEDEEQSKTKVVN
jgi:hypothetical protein